MIPFDFSCHHSHLSGYLDEAIDNAFGDEKYETHGVSLKLQRRGDSFLNVDGKVIFNNTIADIEVFKDVGLFSSAISGVIDINMAIQYDIDQRLKITTKSEILNHKWIEKPKLEIGILTMPVESLVELALKHYEGIITAKIDHAIKMNVDLQSLVAENVNRLKEELDKVRPYGMVIDIVPTGLVLVEPSYVDNLVNVRGGVVFDSNIGPDRILENRALEFGWVQDLSKESIILTNFLVKEDVIKALILDKVKGFDIGGKALTIEDVDVSLGVQELKVNAKIVSPIKADFTLIGNPIYNEAKQILDITEIDVKVDPDGFIYKLSAPLVNKFIESKLGDLFPIELKSLIEDTLKKHLPSSIKAGPAMIKPSVGKVILSKLKFDSAEVVGTIRVEDVFAQIELV